MPQAAAFVDSMRAAFGADAVNPSIVAGMKGEPDCFYAVEGEHRAGTPFRRPAFSVVVVEADRERDPQPARAPRRGRR
jgi:hypothetical protein